MKTFTLVPVGGLANRYYAISSAISFCQDNSISLKVFWFKDRGMGADFHSLFNLNSTLDNVKVIDATWKDYIYDCPRRRNLWLPSIFQYFAFQKRLFYAKFTLSELQQSVELFNSVYLVHCHSFYRIDPLFNYIFPNKGIQQLISDRICKFKNRRVIGLHIRRTDNLDSIKYSPLSLFEDKIREELKVDPDTLFYVASDSILEKKQLINLFGDHILTIMIETRRDNEEGIVEAMVELYTLAHCEKIYGSAYSTYSTLASDLFSAKLVILSV